MRTHNIISPPNIFFLTTSFQTNHLRETKWENVGKPVVPSVALLCHLPLAVGHKGTHYTTTPFPLSTLTLLLLLLLLSTTPMALTAHKNRLQCFIQSMYDEGIVNEQFFQLQSMKEAIRRDFVVRAVTSFCVSCIRLFSNLTDLIYQQEVNFHKVHVLARELYARTTGVGAENVKRECAELLYASEMKDKNHCYQALYRIKNEYSYLRRKLETLVQMERRIIDLDS